MLSFRYDFKSDKFCPTKISFRPRQDASSDWKLEVPSSFQFIGSNDRVCSEDSDWTVLGRVKDGKVQSQDEILTCEVDSAEPFSFRKYRCLGIKVLAVQLPTKDVTSLDDVRMWVRL